MSNHPKAEYIVMREGVKQQISEDDLLVGDLIYLKKGMKVPVDGLFVRGHTLKVTEKYVYGESNPLPKRPIEEATEMKNCPILLGETHILEGSGWMLCILIGDDRYTVKHPAPKGGWSFDNSNLSQSSIVEEQNHDFSMLQAANLNYLYTAHGQIVTFGVISTVVTFATLLICYFMFGKSTSTFLVTFIQIVWNCAGLLYYVFYFIVGSAYLKYFLFSVKDLCSYGIYVSNPQCFEVLSKIKSIVFNRKGLLTTNEYIIEKLWIQDEVAQFEQNFDNLEIVKPLEADEKTVDLLTQSILANIDEVLPDQIDQSFMKFFH